MVRTRWKMNAKNEQKRNFEMAQTFLDQLLLETEQTKEKKTNGDYSLTWKFLHDEKMRIRNI